MCSHALLFGRSDSQWSAGHLFLPDGELACKQNFDVTVGSRGSVTANIWPGIFTPDEAIAETDE